MNRTIAVGTIVLTLYTSSMAGAATAAIAKAAIGHRVSVIGASPRLPATSPKRIQPVAATGPAPHVFVAIVKFQNLWNSSQHAFHIQVEDSNKRVFIFTVTDPAEYAQVQTILTSANGASTDGESISANPQPAAVAPE